jgi:hypothetical protein
MSVASRRLPAPTEGRVVTRASTQPPAVSYDNTGGLLGVSAIEVVMPNRSIWHLPLATVEPAAKQWPNWRPME